MPPGPAGLKTGSPMAPQARYSAAAENPRRLPIARPIRSTAKLPSVNGTGVKGRGKTSREQTAMTALAPITRAACLIRLEGCTATVPSACNAVFSISSSLPAKMGYGAFSCSTVLSEASSITARTWASISSWRRCRLTRRWIAKHTAAIATVPSTRSTNNNLISTVFQDNRLAGAQRHEFDSLDGLNHEPKKTCARRRDAGYSSAKMLRKYSYPTCTFVILTARHLAVGLELGRWEYRCPSPVPQSGSAGCNSLFDNLSRSAGVVEGKGARRACPEQRRRGEMPGPARDHKSFRRNIIR